MRRDKDYKREDKRNKVRDVYGDNFNLLSIYPYEMMGDRTSGDQIAYKSVRTGNPLFKKEDKGFNTFVEVHGAPRIFSCFGQGEVSRRDKKTMEKIIELTKSDTPSDELLILAMCYVDDNMAKYMAEKTNKRVVYGNGDEVSSKVKKSSDLRIKTVTGKNLKMAYPDGRSSHEISKKFLVPVSQDMSNNMLYETAVDHHNRITQARIMFPKDKVKKQAQQAAERDSAKQALIAGGAMSTVQATRKQEQQNPIEKKNSGPSKTSKVTKSFKM